MQHTRTFPNTRPAWWLRSERQYDMSDLWHEADELSEGDVATFHFEVSEIGYTHLLGLQIEHDVIGMTWHDREEAFGLIGAELLIRAEAWADMLEDSFEADDGSDEAYDEWRASQ